MKCPRCAEEMVAYVSARIGEHTADRRLYFSCQCGMLAARNENEPSTVRYLGLEVDDAVAIAEQVDV